MTPLCLRNRPNSSPHQLSSPAYKAKTDLTPISWAAAAILDVLRRSEKSKQSVSVDDDDIAECQEQLPLREGFKTKTQGD